MGEDQPQEGELVIKIRLEDNVPKEIQDADEAQALEAEALNTAGYMMIDAHIKVAGLTDSDIIDATPEQYMANGVIAGILDAIRQGLASGNQAIIRISYFNLITRGFSRFMNLS